MLGSHLKTNEIVINDNTLKDTKMKDKNPPLKKTYIVQDMKQRL